tara:strand:- start:770 stop:1354 length:585 start_codon:yes stop_codon:yes gene_type:complete
MKQILILLILLISASSYSQNWTLNNIDKTTEFGYEYWFSFQNENDESVLKIAKKKSCGETKITGRISDILKNDIPGVSIKVKSKETEFEKIIQADFEGKFELVIDNGEYTIEIEYLGFDKLISDFKVDEKSKLKMNIILGLGPELLVYQINSKKELSENKINEIINCVKQKRNKRKFSTTECSENEEYRVAMHI